MNSLWDKHILFYRISSIVLIVLHLFTFGPIKDALAFSSSSTSYRLTSGALNAGGKDRSAFTTKLWQDTIGEPCAGKITSTSYLLSSGFIPTIAANAPVLTQDIPYQSWLMNSSKNNAFDLDDYFLSPEGYPLSFAVVGNSQINVAIGGAIPGNSGQFRAGNSGAIPGTQYLIPLSSLITNLVKNLC